MCMYVFVCVCMRLYVFVCVSMCVCVCVCVSVCVTCVRAAPVTYGPQPPAASIPFAHASIRPLVL